MSNEAIKIELTGLNNDGYPTAYTCASGTAITKGSIMELKDPNTASYAQTVGVPVCGIAAMSKSATDASDRVTVWREGVFDMVASQAIIIGSWVYSSSDANYPNTVHTTVGKTNPASGSEIMGYARETASDGERINIVLQL